MSNARANAAGDALTKLIVDATKQAPHVIVDATSQRGLTHSQVKAAVENALRDVSRQKLKSIHVLGKDGANAFEVTVNRR